MALEDLLKENNDLLREHNALLSKVISMSPLSGGASTESDENEDDTPAATGTRERGKPAPGRSKRTKVEMEEDRLADEADAAAAGTKSDTTSTKADTTGAVTFDGLKGDLAGWLGEFAKQEDKENPEGMHPEVTARKDCVKTLLTKLGAEKLGDIAEDADKIGKLHNWLHSKGKAGKIGEDGEPVFGAGRWAADPVAAKPASDDLDI